MFDSRVSVGPTASDNISSSPTIQAEKSTEDTASKVIVGHCIDCSNPHDVYSGFIVCTVCRMPVLVCPTCVGSNPTPGEFYCSRHRDFKGIYFTVLERFTVQELESQKLSLEKMLHVCYEHSQKKVFPKVRIDGVESAPNSQEERKQETTPSGEEITTASKNRRRTIRKQIAKVEDRIKQIQAESITSPELQEQVQSCSETKNDLPLVNPKVKDGWGFWRT